MAPKKSRASAKSEMAKSKAQARPESMADIDAANAQHASKKRRALGRRDSDEKLLRQVGRHFAHMTSQQLNTVRVQGLLVHERIAKDKSERMDSGSTRMGAAYWRSLVREYSQTSGTFGSLQPRQDNLDVRRCISMILSLGQPESCDGLPGVNGTDVDFARRRLWRPLQPGCIIQCQQAIPHLCLSGCHFLV